MLEAFLIIKANRVTPTDAKGIFSQLVSLKWIWVLWKEFLSCGLNCRLLNVCWFMYCPVSSSYNVSSLELRNKRKTTQQWSFRVAFDIVLNQVRVYHERVYADNVVSKFWFVGSFSSQHYSKYIINITPEIVSQMRTKECKTGSFICKVNLSFLRSWRHFNCDTVFAVIVSFLNESVHGFSKIRNGSVKTVFQLIEFCWLWKFLVKKHTFSFRDILVHWWVGKFWTCNPPLTFQIQLLWWKVCKRDQCIVWKYLRRFIWNQLYCKRFHC